MTEQAKAARRAYKKEWQRKHPEKVKEYAARYWEKKAAAAELPADDLTETQSGGQPAGAEQLQTITTQSSGQLHGAAHRVMGEGGAYIYKEISP